MIYLDYNATTPVLPEVLEAMMPYFTTEWGNPSSTYKFGYKIKSAIEKAREQVAALIGAHPTEIIFTSCATESNNAAIHAALKANPSKRHIVTSAVEHSSVLNYCKALESEGYRISYLPVDRDGLLNLADLGSAITDDTTVVSLMWANNETGVVFPIKDVAEICYARGILYYCDAVQATGKVDVNVRNLPINYLSLTGHKAHAPKGIGAERNLRGGTESVPLIVGLGKAAELAHDRLPEYDQKVRPLRDSLEEEILERLPNSELNGHAIQRLANTTNIPFHGIESDALLILLDKEGICASSGFACLADSDEPSHVIKAMKPECNGSREMIRFSFDWSNTPAEVETAVAAVKRSAEFLR